MFSTVLKWTKSALHWLGCQTVNCKWVAQGADNSNRIVLVWTESFNIHNFWHKNVSLKLLNVSYKRFASKALAISLQWHCNVHSIKQGAEELCENDPLKEQSLKISQLKDDQYVPASLVSSASIANLQTFKHPSRAAHDLSPGITMVTVCWSSRADSHCTRNLKFVLLSTYKNYYASLRRSQDIQDTTYSVSGI